jgi:acyl-CoA thioester hydrolase
MAAEQSPPLEVRVYYEDTDFSGNVYHAAFLKFMERARTEFLRRRGINHSELAAQGLAFAVTRMDIAFRRPASIDDLLAVSCEVVAFTGARLRLSQAVRHGEILLVEAEVEVAAIRTEGGVTRLPKALRAALESE